MELDGLNNEKKSKEDIQKENLQTLHELEETYKKALENNSNDVLVSQYNHLLAVKREYETYDFENNFDRNFNAQKAVKEVESVIIEFRSEYIGVEARDLDYLKMQINLYKGLTSGYGEQGVELEM